MLPTSRATTLRRLRAIPLPQPTISSCIGIDDFAFKKRHRYGTIVVDLPSHEVVDLLPDREATTVALWMKEHPHIQVVSRDRSGAYADAVNRGAPQALQVADRFHLLMNVTDALQRVVESKHRLCASIAKEVVQNPDGTSTLASESTQGAGSETVTSDMVLTAEKRRAG